MLGIHRSGPLKKILWAGPSGLDMIDENCNTENTQGIDRSGQDEQFLVDYLTTSFP